MAEDLYNNFKFVIWFLVFLLLFQSALGTKPARMFLLLVLFSQIVLNPKIVERFFPQVSSTSKNSTSTTSNKGGLILL